MPRYALLVHPGHNRIYFETALAISQLELTALLQAAGQAPQGMEIVAQAGIPTTLRFSLEGEAMAQTLAAIACSSSCLGLFQVIEQDLLRPVALPQIGTFPEGMNQILRYSGKTNEQFTRLMVNLAKSACLSEGAQKTLLDPMCGKGTTLLEGLIRGDNVVGVEINDKWLTDMQAYLIRYLKTGRFKHRIKKEKRSDERGRKLADGFLIETAATRDDFVADARQKLQVFASDTRNCDRLLRKQSCDMIVSDLPYGVQHGSKTAAKATPAKGTITRRPDELLAEALPGWVRAMKPGASLVISFNAFTLKTDRAAELCTQAGLQVLTEAPFAGYAHRVDQSINRDLVVARLPL
ncbi:TRM11 family SAM-dependent methyltransferase [Polycladidibacter hongkongensis]|uniref:TRM11 family SAM-dependent methyltransferase n=1 Tax=Polycladidibacter hongkongensis TaxID=1647556 RepID=UPI000833CBE7|nr:hypothetical protein [Pseudovibrio hongkongensis]